MENIKFKFHSIPGQSVLNAISDRTDESSVKKKYRFNLTKSYLRIEKEIFIKSFFYN